MCGSGRALLNLKINKSFLRPNSGEKKIHFIENGCRKSNFVQTGSMDRQARYFSWDVFKFKNSNSIYFTVKSLNSTTLELNFSLNLYCATRTIVFTVLELRLVAQLEISSFSRIG